MEAYMQRVLDEKAELDAKLEKLSAFINSEKVNIVPLVERKLLELQAVKMKEYSDILDQRIALFNLPAADQVEEEKEQEDEEDHHASSTEVDG